MIITVILELTGQLREVRMASVTAPAALEEQTRILLVFTSHQTFVSKHLYSSLRMSVPSDRVVVAAYL